MIIPTCPSGGTGIVATIALPSGSYPYAIAINPAGTKLYTMNQGTKSISVIDIGSYSVQTTVTIGGADGFTAGGLWPTITVSRDGNKVYFANAHDTYYGELGYMNTSTYARTLLGTYPAGRVAANPTKDTVWATVGTGQAANVWSTTTDANINSLSHYYPNGQTLRYNADGTGYCSTNANQVSWGWVNSDGTHQAIKQDYRVATNDSYGESYMSADGTKIWATLSGVLWEFSIINRSVGYVLPSRSFTYSSSAEYGIGIVLNPAETKAILWKWGSNWNFKVVDIVNMATLNTYTYGAGVSGAVISPDGLKAYIANYADSTVTVYRF